MKSFKIHHAIPMSGNSNKIKVLDMLGMLIYNYFIIVILLVLPISNLNIFVQAEIILKF